MIRTLSTRGTNTLYEFALRLGLTTYRRPYAWDVDGWNKGYAEGEHNHYNSLNECARYGVLLGYMHAKPGPLRILDVGCGVGLLRDRISDDQIERYVGTDTSSTAIVQANCQSYVKSEFHVCDLPHLCFGKFDLILCNEMLYYVADVPALLRRLHSMLKPDGWLLTSITRHPGDFTLDRELDARFERLDAVTVKSAVRNSKWHIACHAKFTDTRSQP